MDSIILIGFMGSGKSSVGTLLAKELRFRFIDTDREMERSILGIWRQVISGV